MNSCGQRSSGMEHLQLLSATRQPLHTRPSANQNNISRLGSIIVLFHFLGWGVVIISLCASIFKDFIGATGPHVALLSAQACECARPTRDMVGIAPYEACVEGTRGSRSVQFYLEPRVDTKKNARRCSVRNNPRFVHVDQRPPWR
jgi:hypothetical protein